MISRIPALAATLILAFAAPAFAADKSATYQLTTQNGSGETGTVTLAPSISGNGTWVVVVVNGTGGLYQPMHVHDGPCAKLGKVDYPLMNANDGQSITLLPDVPMSKLMSGSYAVNVHKSPSEMANYVACTDLKPQ
jgi:hypothetical protein